MLESIDSRHFAHEIPAKPSGRYAHIVVLRETESYAVFQTDGELNTARVRSGLSSDNDEVLTRIVLFKRKQSTPERLVGRELLRRYGVVDGEACDYNVGFCMKCPDCIYYGFAIGDSGSEKSKIVIDTAFSITGYDDSHTQFTLNAPYESGTPFKEGKPRSAFAEQDHVSPQVFFPCIETIKDPTRAEMVYVLNNILRTKHYGAQTTRTGKMENRILALIFADGEVFSNLKLTQAVYDTLKADNHLEPPLNAGRVVEAIQKVVPNLVQEDGVVVEVVLGEALEKALDAINNITTDGQELEKALKAANEESAAYYSKYIDPPKKKKGA